MPIPTETCIRCRLTHKGNDAVTPARLFDITENRPENLLLVGTPSLLGFVRDGDNAPDLRSKILAELAVRWCLSRDDTLADVLFGLWDESWPAFMDW